MISFLMFGLIFLWVCCFPLCDMKGWSKSDFLTSNGLSSKKESKFHPRFFGYELWILGVLLFFPCLWCKIKTKQKLPSHYIVIASFALYHVILKVQTNRNVRDAYEWISGCNFYVPMYTSVLPKRTASSVDKNSKQNIKVFGICRFFSVYFFGH